MQAHAALEIEASPRGDGVLCVALAGEKVRRLLQCLSVGSHPCTPPPPSIQAVAVVAYDPFHLACDLLPPPSDEGEGAAAYAAVPGSASSVVSFLTAHRKAAARVAVAPSAATPGALLMATGGADGGVTLWAVSVALGEQYSVGVTASRYLPLHAGEVSVVAFSCASSGARGGVGAHPPAPHARAAPPLSRSRRPRARVCERRRLAR